MGAKKCGNSHFYFVLHGAVRLKRFQSQPQLLYVTRPYAFFFSFHVAKYHTSFRDANIWCHLLYRPTSPQPRPLVFKNLRPFPFSELTFFAFVRKQKSVVWGTPCPPHPTRLVIATGQKFLKICSETINIGTPVMRLLWSIPGLNFSPENANLSHSSICRVRKQSCL